MQSVIKTFCMGLGISNVHSRPHFVWWKHIQTMWKIQYFFIVAWFMTCRSTVYVLPFFK